MENLLDSIKIAIRELRNRRDIGTHWPRLQQLIGENQAQVLRLSSRWLVSICDTYADYGDPIERRNALMISVLVVTIRIADTYRMGLAPHVDTAMIATLKSERRPLYDGIKTLNIDRQDTCLNLAKRMRRQLTETPFFLRIYETIIARMLRAPSLLGTFAALSDRPGYVFPLNAEELPDNHGVV